MSFQKVSYAKQRRDNPVNTVVGLESRYHNHTLSASHIQLPCENGEVKTPRPTKTLVYPARNRDMETKIQNEEGSLFRCHTEWAWRTPPYPSQGHPHHFLTRLQPVFPARFNQKRKASRICIEGIENEDRVTVFVPRSRPLLMVQTPALCQKVKVLLCSGSLVKLSTPDHCCQPSFCSTLQLSLWSVPHVATRGLSLKYSYGWGNGFF